MRMVVQQVRAPRWLVPVLLLLALALIPIAITMALVVAGLTLVGAVVRAFLPGTGPRPGGLDQRTRTERPLGDPRGTPIIDADYQVKDEYEKNETR